MMIRLGSSLVDDNKTRQLIGRLMIRLGSSLVDDNKTRLLIGG